ncbi:hypothetical protein J6590_057228 [Homalodisca vitripennis]|nr:hypothetical protein J6590_094554 [Homalodisca vitripennis]KAG8242868.1 hypothetical protein J6590_057225 [Homalodisca vitripennis]KAG8242871.1 hypothetical protein J6590_057228 [Homalodisca vitripennis]
MDDMRTIERTWSDLTSCLLVWLFISDGPETTIRAVGPLFLQNENVSLSTENYRPL